MYQRWWNKLDYLLITAAVVIIFFGFLAIASASGSGGTKITPELMKQFIYFLIGIPLLIIMAAVDYEFWGKNYKWLYAINILLLVLVLFPHLGHTSRGAQRWLGIGPLVFQPSEFSKFVMIITIARFLADDAIHDAKNLLITLVLFIVPLGLIMKQPDLGTALVLLAILFSLLYAVGVKPFYLLACIAAGVAASPFILHDYQKKRLLIFLDPESDPQGGGWNLIQSKIAIGCGKIWGKGLFAGTQGKLKFVPEHKTDFIFTVIGEEMGLIGGIGLILLYLLLLWQGLTISRNARDSFGSLLALGIVTMLAFHIVINIGMTIGVMPVTGIPLPFISYGGSSLITNMMCIGLLISICIRREKLF